MKNRKGFTLIELLAVIVILAVIMVIAVPQILNVIESSKESVASSSIKLVKDAIKTQIATSGMSGVTFEKREDGCYLFDFNNQESGNASKLSLKNKDKIGGRIEYCNGKFQNDSLIFKGTSGSSSSGGNNNQVAKVCKRAETLHKETCTQTDSTYYCSGAGYTYGSTITYGNLGTKGAEPQSGDAFDCDVTGTGNYERFYYVTDLESDSEHYAVLIYYNNVSGGEANSAATFTYISKNDYISAGGVESNYGSYGNWNKGPLTAIKQLPSTSKWKNVSLTNTIRNIKDETGTERISSFSYEGYAARLLTIEEIGRACNIKLGTFEKGELKNCNYLMENTKYSDNNLTYGYWLESPYSSNSDFGLIVYSYDRNTCNSYVYYDTYYGVRPAIEVPKSAIDY